MKLEPLDRGGLLLTELLATNGTAVNGVPLPRGGTIRVVVGDRITIDESIDFEVIEAGEAGAAG